MQEYKLSQDLNRADPKRTYLNGPAFVICWVYTDKYVCANTHTHTAHTNRVTALKYVHEHEWVLSVGRDKTFQWYCAKTGRKLGSFEAHAWCLAVEYPIHIYIYTVSCVKVV